MPKCASLLPLLLAIAAGCGSGPKLVPVSGVVTLNGKPLGEAAIRFLPDPPDGGGLPADDTTGPEGNYKIQTNGRSGVVPGKYRVVITKVIAPPAASVPDAFKDDPFMADLSSRPPDVGKAAKKADDSKIEGEFEREVPPEGGEFDFDVKGTSKAAEKAGTS